MSEVDKKRKLQTCEPMSDNEKRFDAAPRDLQSLISSVSLLSFNTSNFGKLSSQESMIFEELRRQKRVVAELRAKVAVGRSLASLRQLTSKVTSKRQPNSLRDAEGQQVEDQSRWGDTVHEHFEENSNPMTWSIPRPREGSGATGYVWRSRASTPLGNSVLSCSLRPWNW